MNVEIWFNVKSFSGYQVSSYGRVRSTRTSAEPCILKPCANSKGYMVHVFMRKGKRCTVNLHRLVAEHFCERTSDLYEVSHKDGNKSNCRSDNLLWESHLRNIQRRVDHQTDPVGERNPRARVTPEQVINIRARHAAGEGLSKMGREFGITPQAIWRMVNRLSWAHVI